jgi:hypothetical protein
MFCCYLTLAFLGSLVSPSKQAVTTCYVATVVSGSNANLTATTCSASNTFGGGTIYNYCGVITLLYVNHLNKIYTDRLSIFFKVYVCS